MTPLTQTVTLTLIPETLRWAHTHFGTADLGDRRRTRRLVQLAQACAQHPDGRLPAKLTAAALKALYRWANRAETTMDAVQTPHRQHTLALARQQPVVLFLHDTTELDFTAHPALQGTGPIGNGGGRGFLQHNTLALVPEPRQVLGLAHQQLVVRQPAPKGETTYQRYRRRRESALWADGIRPLGEPPPDTCWVDVADAGADVFEAMAAARAVGHHFLFRASQERSVDVALADTTEATTLLSWGRLIPAQASDTVTIPAKGGRPARSARVVLGAAPATIQPPKQMPDRDQQMPLPVWVVHVWEPNPPPDTEALEWLLITSLPTRTAAEVVQRRDWYALRSLVEVFHQIEKTGCREEQVQVQTKDRLAPVLGLLSVVAVRLLQWRLAQEAQPDAPAAQVATADELAVVQAVDTDRRTRGPWTVDRFVRAVARLGGFLGRKGDGRPGWQTLWRGYQRLHDLVQGYRLHHAIRSPPKCG